MSQTVTLKISGMHCPSCKALIEMDLRRQEGVSSAAVDLNAGEASVEFEQSVVSVDKIKGVIEELGYRVA